MQRALPVLAMMFAVLPDAVAAPGPKGTADATDYFPTKKGTMWVYSISGSEFRTTISEVQEGPNGTTVIVSHVKGGAKATPIRRVLVTKSGVFTVEDYGTTCDPPRQTLKYPLKAKDTWHYDIPAQFDIPVERITFTAGEIEEVEVPAGKFKAFRIDAESSTGKRGSFTDWYAPGIGMVRCKTASKDWELKSFIPGK